MCSQGLARGKKAGVEEEKQEAAEATQGQRQPWGTLQKSFRHVVEKMRSEEMKVAHLSHGLQHLCRVAFASPVRHVAHHSPKRSFVVLDAESTLHFLREDGSLVRSVAAPAPMTGLLYAAKVDRFVGWDTEGLLVLDSSFQLLSQVPSRFPIHCGLYSEQLNRIVTAGEGNLTLWGFRYGFRSLQCHAAVSEGLEPSDVFTHLALGADSPESQSCFTACDTGAAAFDIAKGRLLSFKKDLHSRVITGLAYCHVTGCVVTASRDTTIKVWDKNWNIQTVFVGHTAPVIAVTIYPDRPLVFSASQDGTIRTWNLDTIDQVDQVHVLEPVETLETKTASHVVSTSGSSLNLWKINKLYSLYSPVGSPVKRLSCSNLEALGNFPVRLLCVGQDSTVRLVEAQSGLILSTFSLDQPSQVQEAAYCLPRETLFVLTEPGSLLRINAAADPMVLKKSTPSCSQESKPCCLLLYSHVVDPEAAYATWCEVAENKSYRKQWQRPPLQRQEKNRYLPVLGHTNGFLSVVEWFSGRTQYEVEAHGSGRVTALAEYPAQTCVISAGADLTVKMWRLFPYAEECLVPLLCFSCNSPATHMCSLGETLAVAFQDPETITHRIVYYSLMEQTCYEHKPEDDAEDEITGLCCCPNLTLFASASRDGSVKVWDIKNKLLRHLKLNTIPESLVFANRWGDLLVGIERHLYLIHHNKYLPNYYRMKFLCTKFLEPLKDIPLPLSNSCFEALVKENVRRLLHEPPLEEAESPLPGAQRQETKAPPRDSQPPPRVRAAPGQVDRSWEEQPLPDARSLVGATPDSPSGLKSPAGIGARGQGLGRHRPPQTPPQAHSAWGGVGLSPEMPRPKRLHQGRDMGRFLRVWGGHPPLPAVSLLPVGIFGGQRKAWQAGDPTCSRAGSKPPFISSGGSERPAREIMPSPAWRETSSAHPPSPVGRSRECVAAFQGAAPSAHPSEGTCWEWGGGQGQRGIRSLVGPPSSQGLSGLAERDRDLLRLQTGRMSPAKKGRVTQEMKEEAFERYLRIFYKEQPKMEIPKEDPFDADEVLEALRHVDSVAKLYGPARPNMFLGCFPRPSILKPAEQTPPEASPLAESSSRVPSITVPSLGRIPLAVTLEALVQFSRGKKDRKEEEAALLEKEQAPPLKGPILSPREASPSAQAPKPPLTPSVSPQAISAAGSREGRRKGRRKKKSDKGLGVVHEPDTAPAFSPSSYVSPAPGGVAEAIPHEKSISFKESPSVVQRQASHKRSSSPSSRPRSQTSVIIKGFFPERHPESPEWSRSQIRRALGSRQSVPLPGISSGYIPNSVVAQQLHVWDQPEEEEEEEYRQERLVEVTGPQEELESLSGISSTWVMGSEESEESPAWEPSGAKPAGSSQSPVKESPPEVFLTQLDASQYPDKEQIPPSFILPLVDTEWFQKMFPEGFPPETTLQQFLAMLLGNIVTADFNTKTELLGAVLSLKEQLKDRMRQTVYKTLLHVLNMKEGSPSMQERSQRKFILASLRALMDINKDSKELMVELVTYYVMAPPPFRAAVKDLIQDVGVQDPHDYFYKELESWPVGEQETKESVRRRSKQWLDGAMQELQEFRRRFLGQEVLAEQKSLSEISLTELRSTESPLWEHMSPEEDEDNFEEQPEWKYSSVSFEEVIFLEKRGAAAGQEGTPPEAEKAFYGHREGAEKEEMRDDLGLEEQQEGRVPARRDQEEPLGDEPVVGKGERPERKRSTKRAQKGTEVTEQRLHLVHPIDAIHHFMEKQLERELEEMKRVVSAALDTPRDTVMVLPPIRKKRAILRLGETNTMWRKRLPERFYFPYIFPRYLMKGFVPFVKLPLPKINLDVFPAPSERPLSPKTFGAMQQSVHRYFIPKFSYADSYP
ncbi:WD repeat-containing protein 97 [Pogona vitticeps]